MSNEPGDKDELDAAEDLVQKLKEKVEIAGKSEFVISVAEAGLAAAKQKVPYPPCPTPHRTSRPLSPINGWCFGGQWPQVLECRKAMEAAATKFRTQGGPKSAELEKEVAKSQQAVAKGRSF
jgi:hypothetical protein